MSETKVDETKPSETKPKRMVRRSVVITLGVICIILIAGIAGIWLYYLNQNIEKDETITNLNNEVFNKDSQISQLNSNVTNLQNQVNNLTESLNLQKSTVWVDSGTVNLVGSLPTYEENASIAGYVAVQVSNQYEYNATVEVRYSSHGVNYENSIIVGNSGTAVFPVLPSSSISIYIFQTFDEHFILSGPLYATVTITYYY